MPDELIGSTDGRIAFLAGKVEREGLQVPFDVIEYLAERCSTHQALKAAFGSIHSHALLQRVPIDMTLARRIVEGIEPEAEADDSGSAHAPEPEPEPAPEPESALEPESAPESATEPESEPLVTEEPEPVLVSPHDVVQPQRIEAPTLFPPEPHTVAAPASAQPARTPSTVWFAPVRTAKKKSLVKRVGSLVKRAGLENVVAEDDLVAIKLHFGEEGNTGFVHPIFLREIVRRVRSCGGKPFLTDANTLYRGKRANAVDHITCAVRNGFSFSTVNAPVVIADGLDGKDGVDVPITGFKHFDTVRIGAAAVHADALVVVSHFKGHEATGFGGALKNLGMGLGTRSAKQRMHSDLKPQVTAEKCTACKRCVKSCPVRAISIGPDRVAVIDHAVCYGCGECVAACPYGAIGIQWKTEPDAIQEKIVEHCAGALDGKDGKALFVSFVNNVSPDCDCWNFSDASIVADIGVLVSTDPVAIDQAALDLVNEAPGLPGSRGEGIAPGQDKFLAITGVDGTLGLAYAERMGLGSRTYELVTVE